MAEEPAAMDASWAAEWGVDGGVAAAFEEHSGDSSPQLSESGEGEGSSSSGDGSESPPPAPTGAAPAAPAKERQRGQAWSEEEHKRFLVGLERFGKGDWRSIARQCVKTRTPTQVASHAQKYYLRLEGAASREGAARRRVSIHDITSVTDTMPARKRKPRVRATPGGAAGRPAASLSAPISPPAKRMAAHPTPPRPQPTLSWAPMQTLP